MNVQSLVGKTITSATKMRHHKYGYLRLEFSDGTTCDIVAQYSMYTGASEDEYPTLLSVFWDNKFKQLIPA